MPAHTDHLRVLQANMRKAVADGYTSAIGGGVFTPNDLRVANAQIDALRDRVALLEAEAVSEKIARDQPPRTVRGTNWRISYDGTRDLQYRWTARWGGLYPPSGVGEDITYHALMSDAAEWLVSKGAPKSELHPHLKPTGVKGSST